MTNGILILVAGTLATLITRFLPFAMFHGKRGEHPFITYLGMVLPYASIGLLVVYALKDVSFIQSPYGLPEAIALFVLYIIHKWLQNPLISIAGGTVVYMFLVQTVF